MERTSEEVLRVNPVAAVNPHLRRALEREHKVALGSDRAARTFKQYRLNLPGDPVDTQPLITTAEWARSVRGPFPALRARLSWALTWAGRADHGQLLSAIWPSGRIEAWALAPGVPSLAANRKVRTTFTKGPIPELGEVGRPGRGCWPRSSRH